MTLPFGPEFVSDVVNRTHVAQDQDECLLAAELVIKAQRNADGSVAHVWEKWLAFSPDPQYLTIYARYDPGMVIKRHRWRVFRSTPNWRPD